MDVRIALVTGANKGIGYEVVRQLATLGHRVLLAARNESLGEAAAAALRDGDGLDVRFIPLDVTDRASIARAAERVTTEHGRLDVLVNNAGINQDNVDGPPSSADMSMVRRVFDTNFFGAVEITQALLPLLRKSSTGRIVNVSSELASISRSTDPDWHLYGYKVLGYNSSKAALNMFTVLLAGELAGTTIKVNAADPGYTQTDMTSGSGSHSVKVGAREIVRQATLPDDGPSGSFSSKDGVIPF